MKNKRKIVIVCLVVIAAIALYAYKDGAKKPYETDRDNPLPIEYREPVAEMTTTPNSTCFSEVGYSDGSLFVTFRESGATYEYKDVPQRIYDAFWSADSMGGYYNEKIKGYYECHRLS